MLEHAVNAWHSRHASAYASGVLIVPPDVFFPTWDPMQRNTFRQRCAHADRAHGPLAVLRQRTCQRLQSEGFEPRVPSEA